MKQPNTKFAKAGFMSLPPWAKGVLAIGIGVGAYVIISKVVTAPKKIKEGAGNRDENKEVGKEYDNVVTSGTKPTITQAQMSQYANQLHIGMDGYGTDEEKMVKIICKLKNDADVLGVIKAYGTRTVSSGAWNPSPDYKGNLAGAFGSELSSYWTSKMNKCLNANGIKHQF